LLIPDRFDRAIKIPNTYSTELDMIFKIHTKNKSLEDDFNLKTLAEVAKGFNGAETEYV